MKFERNRPTRRFAGLVCRIFAVGAAIAFAAATAAAAPAIVTRQGPLKGIETPTMNEYLGIPYAAPPVGPLRPRSARCAGDRRILMGAGMEFSRLLSSGMTVRSLDSAARIAFI